MKLLELNKSLRIDWTKDDSVEVLIYRYKKQLNSYNFRTGSESKGISFDRKIKTITNSGENRIDAWRVLRNGEIKFNIDNDKLNIKWIVKLDTLYFLSLLIGILIGLTVNLGFNFSFTLTILTGLFVFLVSSLIGIKNIISRINEINFICNY